MPFDEQNKWVPSPSAAMWHYEFKAAVAKALGMSPSDHPGGYDMVVLIDAIRELKGKAK